MNRNRTNLYLILIVLAGLLFLAVTGTESAEGAQYKAGKSTEPVAIRAYMPMIYKPDAAMIEAKVYHPKMATPAPTLPVVPVVEPEIIPTVDPIEEPIIEPEAVADCGQWQSAGPHPCPGGQGNGEQNGNADMAAPTPEPQRNQEGRQP